MRALLIVIDSLGIGPAPDADHHGHRGADTLGHLFAHLPDLALPGLFSMGLGRVLGGGHAEGMQASYGRARVKSPGTESTAPHWEMTGVVVKQPFAILQRLPARVIEGIEEAAGTALLIDEGQPGKNLRAAHGKSGHPILRMLPGESAVEISARADLVPPARLHAICRAAQRQLAALHIARVYAQPLDGKGMPAPFRHACATAPPRTVLNAIAEAGLVVEGVGGIPDFFGRSGVSHSRPAATDKEALAWIEHAWGSVHDGLVFANLPDCDRHGDARDVAAFGNALAAFDGWLVEFLKKVTPDDLVIITADHGNDPAFPEPGHTREEVPLLAHHDGAIGPLGVRETLADIAATLAGFFGLKEKCGPGKPLFDFAGAQPRPLRIRTRHATKAR